MPKKQKKQSQESKVTLTFASGEEVESTSDTTFDALCSLPIDYIAVKQKGSIKLEKDGKSAEKFFYLKPLRRVVVNRLVKAQLARDLEYLLQ